MDIEYQLFSGSGNIKQECAIVRANRNSTNQLQSNTCAIKPHSTIPSLSDRFDDKDYPDSPGAPPAPLNLPSFWMEPSSGNVSNLVVGDESGFVITGSPIYEAGPEYHAGIVGTVDIGTSDKIYFPNVQGPGFTSLDEGWWVGGAFKFDHTPSNEGICGNGGFGASFAGFRVLISNAVLAVGVSDGTTQRTQNMPHRRGFASGEWYSFILQFKVDASVGEVQVKGTIEGHGIYNTAQNLRTMTGLTGLSGAVPNDPGIVIGDERSDVNSKPFDGSCVVQGGTLLNNEFMSEEDTWRIHNYNRSRIYSDFAANHDFVKIPMVGPMDSGLNFSLRCDESVRAVVYDKATYTQQGQSALTSSVDGFVKAEVTGLTAGQEVQVEFENAAGNVASMEWHHKVIPASGQDVTIGVAGCGRWSERLAATLTPPWNMTHRTSHNNPDYVLTHEWGYFDPDITIGSGATLTDMVSRFDDIFLYEKSYVFHCHNSILTQPDDHQFENDGDSTSDFIDIGVDMARLMNPTNVTNYRHATEGWDFSINLGRFKLIVIDVRSGKIDGTNMMSSGMSTWFDGEITAAESEGRVPIIMWGAIQKFAPSSPTTNEHWDNYAAELTARYDHISSVLGTANKRFFSLSADIHVVGLASTSQSQFDTAGLLQAPVICASPWNHETRSDKGDWDHLRLIADQSYGIIEITDSGSTFSCDFEGWGPAGQHGTTMTETITQ